MRIVLSLFLAFGLLVSVSCTKSSSSASDDGNSLAGAGAVPDDEQTDTSPDVDATNFSIVAHGHFYADNSDGSTVSIELLDSDSNPIVGITPTIAAAGTGITITQNCTPTDSAGRSTCFEAIKTTTSQNIAVSLVTPATKEGNIVVSVPPFDPSARGYQTRHCGFDMDNDGIFGEADDDCNVCDGVTTNVDADPQDEDLFYVDSVSGSDDGSCGSPTAPCATLSYTIANRLDGTSASEQDIVCVSGTFSDISTLASDRGGKAVGPSIQGGVEYPAEPFMIVGWDKDNDGRYPPFDQDDIAVFTGGSGWWLDVSSGADNIEIGHLTINDYNHATSSGIVHGKHGGVSHLFAHDIESLEVNKGAILAEDKAIFNLASGHEHWTIHNNSFQEMGVLVMYGYDTGSLVSNSHVFDKNSVSNFGVNGDGMYGTIQMAGVDGFTISRNIFDTNISPSTYIPVDHQIINLNHCSQNILVQDNDFLNAVYGLNIFVGSGITCNVATQSQNITVDRNYFNFSDPADLQGETGVAVTDNNGVVAYTIRDVNVTNNIFDASSHVPRYFVFYNVSVSSSSVPGSSQIVGNTFYGDTMMAGVYMANTFTNGHNDIFLTGNIFEGNDSRYFVEAAYDISSFSSTYNTFGGTSQWSYDSVINASLANWNANFSGTDSKVCSTSFVDAANSNFALSPSDTCAKDSGTDLSGFASTLSVDYVGNTRDTGAGADIGAHQR